MDLYVSGKNEVRSKRAFENELRHRKIKYDFAQNKTDARRRVTTAFGLNSKYTELIPKALAFRPIGDLNDFMFRFLLPEENVNITALKENVQLYRRFEATLSEQQGRLDILEEINKLGKESSRLLLNREINSFLSGRIFVEQNRTRVRAINDETAALNHQLSLCKSGEQSLRNEQEDVDRQLGEISSQINVLDPNGLIATLSEREKYFRRARPR